MSPEPITADRIYRRLKQDILDGILRPGAPLVVQALADHYGVSISPVRDSAHQLVGEQLLASNLGGGFVVPLVPVSIERHFGCEGLREPLPTLFSRSQPKANR